MKLRSLDSTLEASILTGDPYVYYHLVKFERPKPTQPDGTILGSATDYSYITDGPYNIDWDDGSVDALGFSNGSQTYIGTKLSQVGGIQESVVARATTMTIKLSTTALGTIATDNITLSTATNSISGNIDFVAAGFREGDKVLIDGTGNTNKYIIIKRFEYAAGLEIPNTMMYFSQVEGNYTNVVSPTTYTFTLSSEELNALTFAKGSTLYSNYINREVYIYRVHADPTTGTMLGDPFLLFKGIISQGSIEERPDSFSNIIWGLTSHWGDFVRVQGRITSDSFHRALDLTGKTDPDALIKPEYETDFGFMHAERSLNLIATYQAEEKRYRTSSSWGGFRTKVREYTVLVDRDVDLRFEFQAKFIPVVYGVRKIQTIPVFADIPNDPVFRNLLYTAQVLCEGEIGAIYDIYIDDEPSVCSNLQDRDVRGKGYGSWTEDVNVVCIGRADRGDVIYGEHYLDPAAYGLVYGPPAENLYIGSPFGVGNYLGLQAALRAGLDVDPSLLNVDQWLGADEEGKETGLVHEEYYSFYKPIDAYVVFHAGKTDQKGDALLVAAASENTTGAFHIQRSYFEGNSDDYWGTGHTLADSAYTTSLYALAEGEAQIPDLEYVVKGKYLKCYNYDNSFKHDPRASTQDHTNFNLGDTVNIEVHNGSSWVSAHTGVQIIDKWRIFAPGGEEDWRFVCYTGEGGDGTSVNLGSYTKLRLVSGANYWTMVTEDHIVASGDIIPILPVGLEPGSLVYTPGSGMSITVDLDSTDPNYTIMHQILSGITVTNQVNIGVSLTAAPKYIWAIRSYDVANSRITAVPSQGAAYLLNLYNNNWGKIFFRNIVRLQDASSIWNTVNVDQLNVTRVVNGVPVTTTKNIIGKSTAHDAVMVRASWSYSNVPGLDDDNSYLALSTADTYEVKPISDERVSINPAIQLLDYMTDRRYGKGLSLDDINLTSFLESAQLCDTKSRIKIATTGAPSVGDIYRYVGGTQYFQGTVSNVIDRGTYNEVEFDNIIGKLGNKWNDYRSWQSGDVIWGFNAVKIATGTGQITEATMKGITPSTNPDVPLTKVQGGGPATLNVYTKPLGGVYNTNTIIRAWTVGDEWSNPGYSLHDSDDVIYWKYLGWDDREQRYVTRHQMNQLIDTSRPLFDNINTMLLQFNGILRYSNGQYELDIKTAAPEPSDPYWVDGVTRLSEDDIIGNIKLDDKGQKDSYNRITTNIIDPKNKFTARAVSFFNSNYLKEDKGVPKEGQYGLPGITNYYSARTNIIQYLDESRYGLTISFTIDHKGYLLLAGNVIELTYSRFGWTDKAFRVESLNIKPDGLVAVVATEHNDGAYLIDYVDRSHGSGDDGGDGTPPPLLTPPTDLTATQDLEGEIRLDWVNSDLYDRTKQRVEIWAVEAERGTDGNYLTDTAGDYITNDRSLALYIGDSQSTTWVHDGFEDYPHHVWFYWIRYVQPATRAGEVARYSEFHPLDPLAGVVGQAGAATAQAYTFIWTNQVVVLYRDSNGVVGDLNPTAFEFAIYKGGNILEAVPPSTPPGAGQWSLTLTGNANITPDADPYTPAPSGNVVQVDPISWIGPAVTFEQVKIDLNIEGVPWTPSLYQNIHVVTLGRDAFGIVGSNLEHIFMCDFDGIPFVNDFSCWFQVKKADTVYVYDDASSPANDTYHYENITWSSNLDRDSDGSGLNPIDIVEENRNGVNSGVLYLNGASHYLDAGPIEEQAWINVPIHDHFGDLIFSKYITLRKMYSGIRGGQSFILYVPGDVSASDAALWAVDPFTNDTAAQNIAQAVIDHPLNQDGFIRPNDRITVSDPTNNVVGTRIYTGTGQSSSGPINSNHFSTLVVEIFHGSVIVEGTLSADALVADFVIANNARVASNLVIGDVASTNVFGQLYSYQKTSFNDTSPGFFMDAQGHFVVGDQDSYVKFDPATGDTGGVLEIKGNLVVGGNYQLTLWETGDDCELDVTNMKMRKFQGASYSAGSWVRSLNNYSTGSTATLVPSVTTAKYIFGLSNSPSAGVAGSGIDFGFILNADDVAGRLKLWIGGSQSEAITETYAPGDHLQVVYSGSTVTFYNGDVAVYTQTATPEGTYFWESNMSTQTAGYVTYSIGFKEAPNPKGQLGDAGAAFYSITENIPDATSLVDFKNYITINGFETSGSGGVFAAIGRDYAVKGDICVVRDYPHPDAGGTDSRVSTFICTGNAVGGVKWTDADGPSFWVVPEAFIDGELVVDGTIHGRALRIYGADAGDGILIGENDKQRIDILSGGNLRVRLGDLVST